MVNQMLVVIWINIKLIESRLPNLYHTDSYGHIIHFNVLGPRNKKLSKGMSNTNVDRGEHLHQ